MLFRSLIALAKANPGGLNYASGPVGAANYLAAELFNHMAGVQIVRIGYKGGAPAISDLIAGQVQIMFATIGTVTWIVLAYWFHQSLIDAITGGREVTRKEEPRLYNLLENMCISRGIPMPKLKVTEDDALNAFEHLEETQEHISKAIDLHFRIRDAYFVFGDPDKIGPHLEAAEPLAQRHPAARAHLPFVSCRDGDGKPGRDQRPLPRLQGDRIADAGPQIDPGEIGRAHV